MKRIDVLLAEKSLARSRSEAQKLIAAAAVEVRELGGWRAVSKASEKFAEHSEFKVAAIEEQKYVSRAGLKLEAVLASQDLSLEGKLALDIGQSTGGFTDCLLKHGVAHVVGVEVGSGQLAPSLLGDPRITTFENYNARKLSLADLRPVSQNGFDIVVMDVSFISQHLILPSVPNTMKTGAWLVSLVKPQFEAGKAAVGKHGLVSDPAVYRRIEGEIREHLEALGFIIRSYAESPIRGGDGNREFVLLAQKQ
ncbi:23S rRNA (cytidine1920-2'-O)/16S rRNA (cytidine1409-2'-O)-methyltransferase [Alteromonadaceae bacterium Bs31]|nr:23S rRNA (cytidine1920-2'-O)/16S rRNA (cytidine1409-2'-O)-methyltransferase [Alteromonadaceae bacterium Bs31]